MLPADEVSVIVPTLALYERRELLRRAIASILSQTAISAIPIVVLNGSRCDPDIVAQLHADPRIKIYRQKQASLPDALRLGRSKVATRWFSSLDDDDVLLPEALTIRVRALLASPHADAVVTNGWVRSPAGDRLAVADIGHVARDPLRALVQTNWLLPGCWLCETSAFPTLFDDMPAYLECTYLAIQLTRTRRLTFVNEPTVVWHHGSPGSLSSSEQYLFGQAAAIRRLLELDMPPDVHAAFRRKLGSALHGSARLALSRGELRQALRLHFRSLGYPGGWSYLPFAFRLLTGGMSGQTPELP